MNKIRLTKKFSFETAHALDGYDGKCKNIHGHSFYLYVTVIGTPIMDRNNPKFGMVLDYGDLKNIVNTEIIDYFDHAIVLNGTSNHRALAQKISDFSDRIILVDYQPTSEMLLIDFAKRIGDLLPKNINLHSLKLYETQNSYAEWFASDQT